MEWVFNATPRPLYPRETTGIHCIVGSVGPPQMWTVWKKLATPRFDPRTLQPAASRCTGQLHSNSRQHIRCTLKSDDCCEHCGRLTHPANQVFPFNRQSTALKWQHFRQHSNTLIAVLCAQRLPNTSPRTLPRFLEGT
jgi:hypothetical protein